jgi:hypothetical protein
VDSTPSRTGLPTKNVSFSTLSHPVFQEVGLFVFASSFRLNVKVIFKAETYRKGISEPGLVQTGPATI